MRVVNLLLSIATLGTALLIVHTQHAARRNFVAIDENKHSLRLAEQDSDRLEVEKRAQTTPLRIELLAKTKLDMRPATPSITQYVNHPLKRESNSGEMR